MTAPRPEPRSWLSSSVADAGAGGAQPCPACGANVSQNCGYGYRDDSFGYYGEFDCEHPDGENLECDGCPYIACGNCREKGE